MSFIFICNFIRKYPVLNAFFLLLGICLFLGDGQQMLIDTVGAGGVLFVVLVAFLYGKRERVLPIFPTVLWGLTILYCIVRTIFSDDIGYSVYATVRLIEAFLIFSIFYVYTSEEDHTLMPFYVLGFSFFSLFASVLYMFIPSLALMLPKTNLLIPTYGHNNIVDILLFGIPIAFFGILLRKKFFYLYIFLFLLLGVVFSFARAVMIIVSLFIVFSLLFYWRRTSVKKRIAFGVLLVGIIAVLSILIIVPQTSYTQYFSKSILPKITKEVGGANNRFEYWRQAFEAIRERSLFGGGSGTFLLQSKRLQIAPDSYSRHAHNVLLEQMTEVGFVGTAPFLLLFLWVVIRVIRVYRKEQREKRFILVTLTSCVILQTLNAFVDFSLSYFVVEMLFVSVISIIVSLGSDSKKEVLGCVYTILVMGSLSVVFIFYILASLCNTGLLKGNNFVSRFCYLSEFTCTESLKKTDGILKDWELDSMLHLHGKNSDVLFAYAQQLSGKEQERLQSQAISYDSKNRAELTRYLRFLAEQGKYDELGKELLQLSYSNLPKKLHQQLKQVSITSPEFYEKYKLLFGKIDGSMYIRDYYYDSIYYLLGSLFLEDNPDMTKALWMLARDIYPDLGHYHVELASLLYHQYGDEISAQTILNDCQQTKSAAKECQEYLWIPLPLPGEFVKYIQ